MQPDSNLDTNTEPEQNPVQPTQSYPEPPKRVNDFFSPQNKPPQNITPPLQNAPQSDSPDSEDSIESNNLDQNDLVDKKPSDLNQPNEELLLDLKDSRDRLRGTEEEPKSKKNKRRLMILVGSIVAIAILTAVALLIVKPAMKKEEPATQQFFKLPSDITSKTADEQAALKVVELARSGNSDEIVKTWLGAKDISSSKEDFAKLISTYQSSADGKSVELIEKKVGKTNLGVVGAEEVSAVSIVYKSDYFKHNNNLYTKLNLYQPPETPDTWKLYLFEFKAEENNQPLKADLTV